MDKLSRRAEKLAHWCGVIGDWRASGNTQTAFCGDRGLPRWKHGYWLKRVSEEDEAPDVPAFATIAPAASGLRLVFPCGASLESETGFDEATLRRMLQVDRTVFATDGPD